MTFHIHTRLFEGAPRRALAIHCTLGHAGAWRGVAKELQGDLSLLAMDLPSHGKSDAWDREGDLHSFCTARAKGVMDDAPMDLIGHSFGATVALRIAAENPGRVRSLTLIEPVFFAVAMLDDPALGDAYTSANRAFADAFESGDMREAARVFNRDWGDGTPWDALPEKMRDAMARLIHFVPASGPMLYKDNAGLLQPGVLSGVDMPTLLIDGGASPEISGAINMSLCARMPNTTRVTVPGAGHMAPVTHPADVAAAIAALLARTAVSDAA
ncbi:alpha/beta fold hydrolase [Sulfitobacter sp. S190]|uniref:alpha/beta fold hydrolase n=1 Tax=Sulfitobacter sp. S190 TaxID=2867022 RepID=UPI0021A86E84|nr:alpha/beta hydrolase [Sulfitobacter sp. S190]UWR23130.1 alpha/beta hydrolase [Sulfitobacter sp. S190]